MVAPTLLLIGDLDTPPCRFTADALTSSIHGAVHHFPTAAHLPNMECPADFDRAVLDFLAPLGL